jgi:hypothetical protein
MKWSNNPQRWLPKVFDNTNNQTLDKPKRTHAKTTLHVVPTKLRCFHTLLIAYVTIETFIQLIIQLKQHILGFATS